jgi:hypothetical protein
MGRDARKAAKQTPPSTSAAASWPSNVVFLDSLRYDEASVSADSVEKYAPRARGAIKHTRADNRKRARGRIIDDATHPACGEFGLFACARLKARERIIDYHGVVTTAADCSKTTNYSLAFGDTNELAIDAEHEGNEARFCNDFRNTGRSQNAKFESYVDQAGHAKLAIFVLPNTTIAKGEEILISYGKSFWKHRVGDDLECFRSDV